MAFDPGTKLYYETVLKALIPVQVLRKQTSKDDPISTDRDTWVKVTGGRGLAYPRGLVVNVSNLWLRRR